MHPSFLVHTAASRLKALATDMVRLRLLCAGTCSSTTAHMACTRGRWWAAPRGSSSTATRSTAIPPSGAPCHCVYQVPCTCASFCALELPLDAASVCQRRCQHACTHKPGGEGITTICVLELQGPCRHPMGRHWRGVRCGVNRGIHLQGEGAALQYAARGIWLASALPVTAAVDPYAPKPLNFLLDISLRRLRRTSTQAPRRWSSQPPQEVRRSCMAQSSAGRSRGAMRIDKR